jgi:succinyl-CoA synthetase alpha subunit
MGHAGAIISGGKGTADEKMKAMKKAGIHVVESTAMIGRTVQRVLGTKAGRKKTIVISRAKAKGKAKRKK